MIGEEMVEAGESSVEYHIAALLESVRARGGGGSWSGGGEPRVAARAELRSVQLWRAVAAECVASFLYVFIVCGAAGGAGVGASTSSVLLATALASGCAVAALTLCFAHISGAHVNPAVSAALCVRRLVSPLRAALYVAAQCGGAIAGAAMLYGVSVPGYQGNLSAALSQWGAPVAGAWERLGAEAVLTALVVGAHLAAADARRRSLSTAPSAAAASSAAPLALGAAYAACSLVSMPYLNPARSLGPAFVLSRWEQHWVYWVGPLAGALAAALLYELAARPPASRTPLAASPPASPAPSDYDDAPPPHAPHHHRTALPTYCRATAPQPQPPAPEPLYGGTKSLYCRSPPLTRANLHRSQSVYAKSNGAPPPPPGPLVPAHSLYPMRVAHNLAHNQNAHNASQVAREGGGAWGARPGPAGAAHSAQPTYGTRAQPAGGAGGAAGAGGGGGEGEPFPPRRRPDSVYGAGGARRGLSVQSDDSSYGSYAGPACGTGAGAGAGGAATVPRAPPPHSSSAALRHAHY